jgi:hypothetical protein
MPAAPRAKASDVKFDISYIFNNVSSYIDELGDLSGVSLVSWSK